MKPSRVTSRKQNSRHFPPLRGRRRTKQAVCGMLWAALFFLGHPVKGDPSTTDSDQDGYTDEEETNGGYNPNDPTSYPGYEYTIDSDQDGHTDYIETSSGTDPNDPNSYPGSTPPPPPDSDIDGHTDAEEIAAGTNPNDATSYPGSSGGTSGDPYSTDSDGDGYTDGAELDYGTDPYNSDRTCLIRRTERPPSSALSFRFGMGIGWHRGSGLGVDAPGRATRIVPGGTRPL